METTNEQQQAYQVQLRHLLDTHFTPLLKDEWKTSLSFYEAGMRPSDDADGIKMVVVWMRSTDILKHTEGLLKHFTIDPIERIPGIGTGDPRYDDGTLTVRLFKNVDGTDLVVHIFQVFGENSAQNSTLSELQKISKNF